MEEGALVGDAAIDVLHHQRAAIGEGCDDALVELPRRDDAGPGAQLPDMREMALAGARRPDDELRGRFPGRPAVDEGHGGGVRAADEEVLGPERWPVREVEHELARFRVHADGAPGRLPR